MPIADVGAGSFEEIDLGARGANYGWPTCEAFQGANCSGPVFTPPIYAYANDPATCATIGGYVLRDSGVPELFGRYVFADLCDGDLWSIDPTDPPALGGHRVEDASAVSPRSFGEDACGRLYLAAAVPGQVYRLEGSSGGACPPSAVADSDPPETALKLKRKNDRGTRYVARIRSDEPGSTFECKLDRRKWKPCGSKRRLRHLDTGRHRFRARATDAAGNRDPQPAKKRFRTKRR
jgi:hypothetical protein